MTITTNQDTASSDAVERARSLQSLVDEQAGVCEELGKLTDEIDDKLHELGLYGMWVPKSLGGLELDPISSLQVIEAVSYGQPSAGWVLMAAGLSVGAGAAYLGDQAIKDIFTDVERWPIIAGQGTRPGTAKPVDGGYEISGSWSFASGIKHSQYIHTAVVVEGTGEFRICVLPIDQPGVTLIENWDVLGLKATGSIDYTIENVFVPEHYTQPGLLQESSRGGAFYKLGIIQIALICHSGWGLGTGRRILDELAGMAQAKAGRPGQIAESDAFQLGCADAEAKFRAARAFAFEAWNDAWATLQSGEQLSTRQSTLLRLALAHVTWTVNEISEFAYKNGGTTALRAGTMQRLFRDVHAGTQHITSAPGVIKAAGKELAGLAPDSQWIFLDIVGPDAAAPAGH
jgi:alkylation response protein AidB-like acyl-CoA dehydrogenase